MLYESIIKVRPTASALSLDIRSKYTNKDKKTWFVVGQYFSILSRYASSDIVGMFLAWKVMVAAGVDMALREAVVSVCHIGGVSIGSAEVSWLCEDEELGFDCDIWSFVFAMWVKRSARSFRRSVGGKEWMSKWELSVKEGVVGGFGGGGVGILDCEGAAGAV